MNWWAHNPLTFVYLFSELYFYLFPNILELHFVLKEFEALNHVMFPQFFFFLTPDSAVIGPVGEPDADGKGPIFIHCGSHSPNSNPTTANGYSCGTGLVGSSRFEWQKSCAILAGIVMSQEQGAKKGNVGGADGLFPINGPQQYILCLMPTRDQFMSPPSLPRPLTIINLSAHPTHGSLLRAADLDKINKSVNY